MIRTQIQLPDELYERAKRFSGAREMSLAEAVRRALEAYLERFPDCQAKPGEWKLRKIDTGGLKVPVEQLHDLMWADEEERLLEKSRPS